MTRSADRVAGVPISSGLFGRKFGVELFMTDTNTKGG